MHQSGYKELNKSDPKGGGRLNKIHSKGKQISSIVYIIPLNPFKSQECQQQESKQKQICYKRENTTINLLFNNLIKLK